MARELIKRLRYKAGYEVRTERLTGEDAFHGKPLEIQSAYTPNGEYIGPQRLARKLVAELGIQPETQRGCKVCSIGFCAREKKWYGWSHRAICGFGIGDKIFEEDFGDDDTPFVRHGKKTIRTMKDAKLAAERFASSVS